MPACPNSEKLRVVILYDRLDSVGKAMASYSYLKRELEHECQLELSIWRIDVATSVEFAVKADYDIAAAEIVIMAIQGSQWCPTAFQHWKDRAWQNEGAPQRNWIEVVVSVDEPAPAGSWTATLRGAATQIHPDIFEFEPPAVTRTAASEPHSDGLELAVADPTNSSGADCPGDLHDEDNSAAAGLVSAQIG